MSAKTNQNLRILVVLNRLFEWSQNFITRELLELTRQGVEVYVAARRIVERGDLSEEEKSLAENFVLIPENPFTPSCLLSHLKFKLKYPRRYRQAWAKFLESGHRRVSKLGRSLVCLFRAAALAEPVLSKGFGLLHAHFLTAPTETARYLSALTGLPLGCSAHAMDIYKDNSGLRKKIQDANYVTTCTSANFEHLKDLHPRFSSKIFINYHGIMALKVNGASAASPCEPITFLAVGRLTAKKGFSYFLQACQGLRDLGYDFKARIVGEGPLRETLTAQVERLDIGDAVVLSGYVPPHEMDNVYSACHVLVVPSVIEGSGDRDGLPNVCLEAMSHGLPIIGSNVSGVPEAVIDGFNGRIVPPGDVEALRNAMTSFLTSNNYRAMRQASMDLLQRKFLLHNNVGSLKKLMEAHAAN